MEYTVFQNDAIKGGRDATLVQLATHNISWEEFEAEEAQMLLAAGPVPPGASGRMEFPDPETEDAERKVASVKKKGCVGMRLDGYH